MQLQLNWELPLAAAEVATVTDWPGLVICDDRMVWLAATVAAGQLQLAIESLHLLLLTLVSALLQEFLQLWIL